MKPALLGGPPAFASELPYARPTLPDFAQVLPELRRTYESGQVTNGVTVRRLEERIAARVSAADCVAVASCTSGLMILLRALGLTGEVILPSFTFFATAHAVTWNGLDPVLVDCLPGRLTISPMLTAEAVSPRTAAVLGVHVFGNPCDADALVAVAGQRGIPVLYDAAHGLGSRYRGQPIGSLGLAEVFSLGPSKLVCGGEGGVIATSCAELASELRHARDHGNAGSYDPRRIGLNARMSEFHAVIARHSLEELEANLDRRQRLAAVYQEGLAGVPGIRFQHVDARDFSALKDCALLINEAEFGLTAADLQAALLAENIHCRRYFDPPTHRQALYMKARRVPPRLLKVTEEASSSVLCPPFYSHLPPAVVRRIAGAIAKIQEHALQLGVVLRTKGWTSERFQRSEAA